MKTRTRPLSPLRASLMAVAFCAAGASAHGAVFLSFSSTGYVTGGDQHLQGDTGTSLSGSDKYGEPNGYPLPSSLVGRAYSNSTAFSPTTGYSGPLFYGGGSVTATIPLSNEGFHELSVANGGGGDSIHWRVDAQNSNFHTHHIFVFFKKAQFESPWASGGAITSTALASSTFQMHTGQVIESGAPDIFTRWVVQDGSTFWLSQNSFSINQNNLFQTSFASITGWAQYNPTTGLAAVDFDEGSSFAAHTFTDVQGFGFYVEHENGDNVTQVDIDSFVVIPEPSQFFLTGAGLVSLLMRRRRR